MVMLNDLDRFHLVMDVIDRVPGLGDARRRAAPAHGRRAPAPPRVHARGRRRHARRARLDLAAGRGVPRGEPAWPAPGARPRRQRRVEQPEAVGRSTHGDGDRRVPSSTRRARRSTRDALDAALASRRRARTPSDTASCTAATASRPVRRRRPPCSPSCSALTELAPLHQPKSLRRARRGARRRCPGVPAVACFDTAFHATLPPAAATYALPAEWRERCGLRRYGFHGLSHAYASRRAAEMLGRRGGSAPRHLPPRRRRVAGRRARRRSVDTTMGFTPLEGLVMATRSGSRRPRPAAVAARARAPRATREIARRRSSTRRPARRSRGTADMREVLARGDAATPTPGWRSTSTSTACARGIAAMAAALGGLDALVFTGGVGERVAADPRRCRRRAGLPRRRARRRGRQRGRATDDARSPRRARPSARSSSRAREDLEIAGLVEQVLEP